MTFFDLGINPAIDQALQENKITEPTDIQRQAIPLLLNSNNDLVAVAQTGTGKTAAFCLPILQRIDAKLPAIQALVLVPTRELGQQVAREFFLFSKHLPRVFTEAVYGGAPIYDQQQRLTRTTHVVVATPGRLLDLLDRKALKLDNVKFLVLDEADEMMKMGFKTDIDKILSLCNNEMTKMLFTTTMLDDVKNIISKSLRPNFDEIHINAEELVNQNIEHQYVTYTQGKKVDYLKAYLMERKEQRGIAFCRTKTDAKRLAKQLAGFVVTADALHGNLNQEMRDKVMRGFKKNRINLLVATDIAARGLDVKDLDYIIHYHLPEKTEYYTHRSGRTARAGNTGNSVCFLKTDELNELKKISNELNIQFSKVGIKLPSETDSTATITIHINMGYAQGFSKNTLVDFITEEAGLIDSDIQQLVVEDNHSSFTIPQKYEQQLFINLKGYKYAHRNVKLSV